MTLTLWDTNPAPDLGWYDFVLLNNSAGKDSQAMLDYVCEVAAGQGFRASAPGPLHAVHCDLGRLEWPGTKQLAREQVEHYGLPFHVVANRPWHGDLLAKIKHRGRWPGRVANGRTVRYCTSEFKTGPVQQLCTQLVKDWRSTHVERRQVRILNCLGIRADESPSRAKRLPFKHLGPDTGWSNGLRHVDEWLPIFNWSEHDVWDRIRASGVAHHWAYDEGMPRLSCSFCVFASKPALVRAAQLRPDLAQEYLAVEQEIGHRFKDELSMADIIAAAERTEVTEIPNWAA
jgi:3'-phosphoadenosine 5'-phosphosulfate sulfotransferase (PAPS reductase)/FAD synthetase